MSELETVMQSLKNEVERLASEMPDFTYKNVDEYGDIGGCSYSNGGCDKYPNNTGCIMGQAAKNVHKELFDYMQENEGQSIRAILHGFLICIFFNLYLQ